jgi:putative ABC transport system permease protein
VSGHRTPTKEPVRRRTRAAGGPPALAEWLLARALGSDPERDMVLGDLHEQLAGHGAGWYWRESVAIAAHALVRRWPAGTQPRTSGDPLMYTWIKDVRYAWRSLFRRRLLTATVTATLALGLGANAAIFNIIDRIVLRPYPLEDPDHTVMLAETGPRLEYRRAAVSPANFFDWRTAADTMTHLSAFRWWDANLVERGDPERLQGSQVSSDFFDALGIRPALGRGFVRDEETFGRHQVVVLGDALWKRRFAGDPSVVGRRITIDGAPYQVVGIAPPRFGFPDGAQLWAPVSFDPRTAPPRDRRNLTVVGRLRQGRTLDDAQSQMAVIADRLAREYPDANRDHGVRVMSLTQGMMDEGLGPILSLWQVSAMIVLLIACANIANLMLARAAERRREIAVRLALGASRMRVVRELLSESLLLALVAVPPALGVAWLSLRAMRVSMPANIIRFVPGFESLGLDLRLLGFTTALAVLTGCVFGLLPALQASRSPVSDALKEGGRTATGRHLLRRGIVVAEISIALPLLVAAGLGVLGTNRFLNGSQGYDPDGVLTMKLVLPSRTYQDDGSRRRFVTRAMDAVAGVPGVERAAAINDPPASGGNASQAIEIDGHPAPDPRNPPIVDNRVATADYFTVLKIPIQRGRGFTPADREETAPIVVVSASMAEKYWPGEDPIGRRVRVPGGEWITVVGVCGDIIHDWFNRRNNPSMYRPLAQAPSDYFGIVVRTAGDPHAAAGAVRQALLRVDPSQPVFEMMTMRQALSERTIGLQYLAAIMAVFAGLALLLAAVGLYAVIAYLVAQRRHEIGLRIALGASRRDVIRLTVGQALRLALVGTGIGLALSVALGRLMEAGLLGIATSDARVVVGFAAILMASALLAGYLPARRAAGIDPMIALRAE